MTDPAASTSAAAATPALGPSVPAIATHGRRRSLAWRLGLLLGVSVVVVLLLVGVVVNRVVSSGFQITAAPLTAIAAPSPGLFMG